jgi:eukaryotic-like serine/threonine-protein kinase
MGHADDGRRDGASKERYRIVGTLGTGGMAVVLDAIDTESGRRVALKFTRTPEAGAFARARLEQEAEALSRASDPRICAAYGVADCEGWPCLVMERLIGHTLQAKLLAGPLDPFDIVSIATEIVTALTAVHRVGLVHQDIKPANLFVTSSGRIKLLDFGLATRRGAFPTQSGSGRRTGRPSVLGTTNYIAPERILRQPADPRSDLFSLGAVMYEMAAGRTPFAAATTAEALMNVLEQDPPAIDRLQSPAGRALDRLIRTLLAKDPADRYQSAADVKKALLMVRHRRPQAASRVTARRSLHIRGIRHEPVDASCAYIH